VTIRVRVLVPGASPEVVGARLGRRTTVASVPVKDVTSGEGTIEWTSTFDAVGDLACRAVPGRGGVELQATGGIRLPYFHWALSPLWRHGIRTWLRDLARDEEKGRPRHWQFSPVLLTPETAATLATVALMFALTAYCGSLFTQAGAYVSDSFGGQTTSLTTALAVTRIGTLLALAGSFLADRHGRRRVLVTAVAGVCISTLVTAAMPTFATFTLAQTVARGFVNLAATIAFVVLVEEAPDGARGWVIGLTSFAGGLGFSIGVVLLPVSDLGTQAWRALFVVGGLGIALVPGMARRLREPARFSERTPAATRRNPIRQVLGRRYGRRFALLAITGFLSAAFVAASSQLFNPYLIDERGFDAVDIVVFRAVTQGPFTVVAVIVGARLADTRGRRPLMIAGAALGTAATAAFFLTGGPWMWLAAALGTTVGALGAPAWGTASGELFPTSARGSAGGALLVAGVAGSLTGLALAGPLSLRLGSLGTAVAVLGVPAVVATVLLVPFLPEGAGVELDELSPADEDHDEVDP